MYRPTAAGADVGAMEEAINLFSTYNSSTESWNVIKIMVYVFKQDV